MIRKIVLPLVLLFAMVLSACAPAATPSPEVVVEPTQAPLEEPTAVEPTLAATQVAEDVQPDMPGMLDTIKADEQLSLFFEALALSGISNSLEGKGPFTVFAPTNDAINAVPELYTMEQFGKIIYNHVVLGKFMAADLVPSDGKMMNIALAESGEAIMVTVKDGNVYLNNNILLVTTDIETANGVLHVIDAVIMPQPK